MDEELVRIIRQALKDAQARSLDSVTRDVEVIEAVIQARPDLSPLDVMVLINLIRKS